MSKPQAGERDSQFQFIRSNLRMWLEAMDVSLTELDKRVYEKHEITMVKTIHSGGSPGSIESLLAIAHELGLKLQDLVREPADIPQALLKFLEENAEEKITDEEILILKTLHVPNRRLTVRSHGYALDMIRKAEVIQGPTPPPAEEDD